MKTLSIVGLQWGDEGKGKITDTLATRFDYVVRYQGGNNAGHTLYVQGKKVVLHLLPSGVIHDHTINVLGNGMVINLEALQQEFNEIQPKHLFISNRAHLVFPFHAWLDKQNETNAKDKIGTTLKGIGPSYQSKTARLGIRVGSLLHIDALRLELQSLATHYSMTFDADAYIDSLLPFIHKIQPFIIDTSYLLFQAIQQGRRVLFEGAQGVMLDLDHGTYPYVTSSHPTPASIPVDVGIPASFIKESMGIVKAYTTRVGEGPFPTEIIGPLAERIREVGKEYGATTGRPRRIGYLDITSLKHAIRISGATALTITLLDVLSGIDTLKISTAYTLDGQTIETVPSHIETLKQVKPIYQTFKGWKEDISKVSKLSDLPKEALAYLSFIEQSLNVPIRYISVGPHRNQLIKKRGWFHD
jgi:adenylosuccinate synthase